MGSGGIGGCWPPKSHRSPGSIPRPAHGRARAGCSSSCPGPRAKWASATRPIPRRKLIDLWRDEIPDEAERLKFVLASYNADRGHVLDAQRLAEKHGANPTRWEDVAYWLLQKSKPSVYRDRVVRHGYVRGLEPVQYVSRILERYDRYRSVGPSEPE